MARDGSGNYNLPAGNPVVTGTTITSTWANATMPDVGTALTNSISKDGQTTPTANLPMGGNRHTGVADGNLANQYASINQVQNGSLNKVGSVANATDAYTGSIAPAIAAYTDGLLVTMTPSATNTTVSPTLALNGLTVKPIFKEGGVACAIGDLVLNVAVLLLYSTQAAGGWILLNPQVVTGSRIAATASVPDGALSANVALKNISNVLTKPVTVGGDSGDSALVLKNTGPGIEAIVTNAATDAKSWLLFFNTTTLIWRIDNNDASVSKSFMTVTRAAAVVTSISFGNATDNPPYNFLGTGTATFSGKLVCSAPITALDVNVNNAAFSATANASLRLLNASASAQTSLDFLTSGTLSGRIRNDSAGNMNIVAAGGDVNLFVGGDSGVGATRAKLLAAGTFQITDSAGAFIDAGYKNIPQNGQTISYVAVLADANKGITNTFTSAVTFTIPSNASVPYPVGTTLTFASAPGGGVVTIAINSDSLTFSANGATGSRTLASAGMATAYKVTATQWLISGAGLS